MMDSWSEIERRVAENEADEKERLEWTQARRATLAALKEIKGLSPDGAPNATKKIAFFRLRGRGPYAWTLSGAANRIYAPEPDEPTIRAAGFHLQTLRATRGPDGKLKGRHSNLNKSDAFGAAPALSIEFTHPRDVTRLFAAFGDLGPGAAQNPTLDDRAKDEDPDMTAPLNTILYGPPGTGKTYATASRAVAICDGAAPRDRAELMARYETLSREGRIEFVTFHQSYGYEDFVEGLRPQTGREDGDDAAGFRLEPEDGVLKRIARRAAEARPHGEDISALQRKTVFKIALGANTPAMDHVRDRCFEEGRIMFGAANPVDWSPQEYLDFAAILARLREDDPELSSHSSAAIEPWLMRGAIKEGDIAVVSAGQSKVLAIGEVTGPYEFDADEATADGGMHQRRVRWLRIFDAPLDADEIYGGALHRATLRRLDKGKIKWERLASLLGDPDAPPPPHVLIIDEINRANVSKVMGELITLLEEDKRAGAVNALTVTLPFSKDSFSLPANLHILGAMNTADRSIALLDTALRRRFRFEHLGPDPSVLSVVGGVDLPAALRAMNDRLEWLLGPDHLIGHAWFMGAEVADLAALDRAMRDKVIPLLREYFHEDLSRVRAVLGGGDGFLRREKLAPPPGIDDGYEDRHRFVDAWDPASGYGPAAWAQLIGAAPA